MKRLLAALPLLLGACAAPPLEAPKVVYVPVAAVCPKVEVPAFPVLPIESAAFGNMEAWDQTRAVTESLAILMEDDRSLRALLAPYQQPSK